MSELMLKALEISDKPVLDPYLMSNKYGICDYSFSNMFMWRHTYKTDYAIYRGFLIILSSTFDGERHFFMPLGQGDLESVIHDMIGYSNAQGRDFKMLALTPEMLTKLSFLGPEFRVKPAEVWDYVYNTEDLAGLRGKKFHAKRNHINKFDALYSYEYVSLTPELIPRCLELLDAWLADNPSDPSIKSEETALRQAFDNYTALGLSGGGLLVDGRLIAFAFGQPLNSEVFVVHAEKALRYEGAYAKINQLFAESLKGFRYINREEDLGLPGLRKAKMSYNPAILLNKHTGMLAYEK